MKISSVFTIDIEWLANCVDPKLLALTISILEESDLTKLKPIIDTAQSRLKLLQNGVAKEFKAVHQELFEKGKQLHSTKNYNESIDLLCQAISIDPTQAESFHIRGDCYYCLEKYDKAVLDLRKASFLAKNKMKYLMKLGNVYAKMGKKATAHSIIEAVKKMVPGSVYASAKIKGLEDSKEIVPAFDISKIETESSEILMQLQVYVCLAKDFNALKDQLYEIGSRVNFNMDESSHQKATWNQLKEFELPVSQIFAMTLENHVRAHSLMGYLFERGLVVDSSRPSGYYLAVIGSNFHYSEYLRLAEEYKSTVVKDSIKKQTAEFSKTETMQSSDKSKRWRLNEEEKSQYLFNQAISYEIAADGLNDNVKKKYYYGWAQYYYEQTAGIYGRRSQVNSNETSQARSFYNLGILYKLGKGMVNPDIDNLIERMPMNLMAYDYFELSAKLKYAPAYYEIYKMYVKGILKSYATQEQMIKIFVEGNSFLDLAVKDEYGPALKRKGLMQLYAQHSKEIDRGKALTEALALFTKAVTWYQSKTLSPEAKFCTYYADLSKEHLKEKNIVNEPYYFLVSYKFSNYVRSKCIGPIIQVLLFESLKGYAKKKSLPFAKDLNKTKENLKNLANCILSSSGVIVSESIANSNNPSKNIGIPNADPLERVNAKGNPLINSVRNYKSYIDEGDKWFELTDDLNKWITSFSTFVKKEVFDTDIATFKKYNLVEELKEKCKKFNIPEKDSDYDVGKAFKEIFNMCTNQLKIIKKIAMKVYPLIPWQLCSLSEQIYHYDIGSQLIKSDEKHFTNDNIKLARELLMKCHFLEEGMQEQRNRIIYIERIRKHCESVITLDEYAAKDKISVVKAIEVINKKITDFSIDKSMMGIDVAHIGYKCALAIISMRELKATPFIDDIFRINAIRRKERNKQRDYTEFNTTWLEKTSDTVKWIALKGDVKECSLVAIFDRACKAITAAQDANPLDPKSVRLNYKAITYEDPYVYLYARDIDSYYESFNNKILQQMQVMPKENLSIAAQGTDPIIVFYIDNLQSLYDDYINILKNLVPETEIIDEMKRNDVIKKISSFFGFVNEENSWRTVYYKKFFLFYMKIFLATKNINEIIFRIIQLLWGLEGRCIDGKYSFFNEWFVEYIKDNNEDLTKLKNSYGKNAIKNMELRIRLSQLILEMKKSFINRHLTRTKEDLKSETLLCSKVLLYQLLMEPLGIPGFYTRLKYPGFSMTKVKKYDTEFKIEELMRKYLNGGSISFTNPEHTNVVLAMNPKRLVSIVRAAIFNNEGPMEEQDTYAAIDEEKTDETDGNKFKPYDKIYTKIPYRLIQDYINSDIEMVMDYKAYLDNNLGQATKFFKAEGQHFKNILSDKIMLKMLSEFGYVEIGPEFLESVNANWTIP